MAGCEGQAEITQNHSSAMVSSTELAERGVQPDRQPQSRLIQAEAWVGEVAVASYKEESAPLEDETAPAGEEQAVIEEVPLEEEPVSIEEVVEKPSYEAEDVEPAVEEPTPVEPVYTYAPTYEEVVLPYPTQYIGNPQMDNDQVALRQVGVNGKEVYTWLHVYKDGVWESKHITKTSRTEPVPEIIDVGTNIVVIPEHSSYEQELAKMKELYPGIFQ